MEHWRKIELTEKQIKWLTAHFKHTKNEEIAKKLNISPRSVVRIARKLGLKKTPQFMHKCQRETSEAARTSNIVNGTYPPKGFIIPGSEAYRFKPGETSRGRLGARREKERLQKSAESRRRTIKKEKARIIWGLPQKTKLKLVRQPRAKVLQRHYLRQRGYIVEGNDAYYDSETKRSPKIEAAPKKYFNFYPMEEGDE